jgi:endonuclease/exonuclease/phosphatase family metal-dependent hydrolase
MTEFDGMWLLPSRAVTVLILVLLSAPQVRAFGRETFVIASLNMDEKRETAPIVRELRTVEPLWEVDFFLMQEVADGPDDYSMPFELGMHLGLPYCFAPSRASEGAAKSPRLAILSRYPFQEQRLVELPRFTLRFKSRRRYAMEALIRTPGGDLRILNLHLDSRINFGDRMAQLNSALAGDSEWSGSALVGGDFNSSYFLWVFNLLPIPFVHRQDHRLVREMTRRGYSTPFTDHGRTHDFPGLKIDWIFGSGVAWGESGVVKIRFSDHRLIWAELAVDGLSRPRVE